MQIEITKNVKMKETIDIEFPYYFKHDFTTDVAIVSVNGKVEINRVVTITMTQHHSGEGSYDFRVKYQNAQCSGTQLTDEYRSSEQEFETAYESMVEEMKELK